MFQSFHFISECNSPCKFWSIKFSIIWVSGSGKILRRALWLLGSFVTLECIQQLRQGAFSRVCTPGRCVASFLQFWETLMAVREWFFWCSVCFPTGFVFASVEVQGNKLGNPSKSFQASLCGSAHRGWNMKVFLHFQSEISFVTVVFYIFFFPI